MCRQITKKLYVFALLFLSLSLTSMPAKAEMYVAGQVGANIPSSLSNVEYSAFGVTLGGMTSRCRTPSCMERRQGIILIR